MHVVYTGEIEKALAYWFYWYRTLVLYHVSQRSGAALPGRR